MKENERIPTVWINKIPQISRAVNFDIQFDDRMAWFPLGTPDGMFLSRLVSTLSNLSAVSITVASLAVSLIELVVWSKRE